MQGVQGTQGLQGVQGLSIQGTQGSPGLQGFYGTQGIQGIAGSDGSGGSIGGSAYQILYKDSNGDVTGNYNLTVSGNVASSDVQIHDLSVYSNVLHGHDTNGLTLYANEYYRSVGNPGPLQSVADIDLFGDSVNVFNNISVSGRLFIKQTGTAAQPAISFVGDEDTGIYHPLTNWMVFATSGTPRMSVSEEGVVVNSYNKLILPSGSSNFPSVVFYHPGGIVDADSGLFSPISGVVSVATQSVERLRIGTSGDMSSVVEGGSTLYPSYMCRAFVNFDGTTNTAGFCTIRKAGNVTSVTDNGVGLYTINFDTAMPDSDYTVSLSSQALNFRTVNNSTNRSTSSVQIGTYGSSYTSVDDSYIEVAIFR